MKYFRKRVPGHIRKMYNDCLGLRLGWFATYGDILDKLFERGYWVELEPFHTFAFPCRTGFLMRVWKHDTSSGIWNTIFDERSDWMMGDGYGASFECAMGYLAKYIVHPPVKNGFAYID